MPHPTPGPHTPGPTPHPHPEKKPTMNQVLFWVYLALIVIGGINWGLVAINPKYDIVAQLFSSVNQDSDIMEVNPVGKVVYILIAISAILIIPLILSDKKILA
jgi:uncharacterized membrane protein YuzA (DUF378 family)